MDWNARIEAVRQANLAAVDRFDQRIGEIDAAARAAMRQLGERSRVAAESVKITAESVRAESVAEQVSRDEQVRLRRQDAALRTGTGRRDAFVLPTDWTAADEARWRG
ncbi:hypothetical protein ACFXHA_27265 [Nocardia sp. NPDC059240]|uniref:hypothetical protein n=1 Tax=Nocardia sp. NPDC059240 TaxID=3346786 RepID=UPI0036967CF7